MPHPPPGRCGSSKLTNSGRHRDGRFYYENILISTVKQSNLQGTKTICRGFSHPTAFSQTRDQTDRKRHRN